MRTGIFNSASVVHGVSFIFASWLIVAKCLLQRESEREKWPYPLAHTVIIILLQNRLAVLEPEPSFRLWDTIRFSTLLQILQQIVWARDRWRQEVPSGATSLFLCSSIIALGLFTAHSVEEAKELDKRGYWPQMHFNPYHPFFCFTDWQPIADTCFGSVRDFLTLICR